MARISRQRPVASTNSRREAVYSSNDARRNLQRAVGCQVTQIDAIRTVRLVIRSLVSLHSFRPAIPDGDTGAPARETLAALAEMAASGQAGYRDGLRIDAADQPPLRSGFRSVTRKLNHDWHRLCGKNPGGR